ncbi:MAG: SlyX family protein [Rhizobiaceae bacterium]
MSEPHQASTQELEEQIAHQAKMIDELSEQLAAQWKTIDALQSKLDRLSERFGALEDLSTPEPENQRPPHW